MFKEIMTMITDRVSSQRFNLSRMATLLLTIFMTLVMAGCGGNSSSGMGTLGVSLTDAPACGFDAVNVTVSKVRVHQSSSAADNAAGWSEIILNPARKINLLDLNNGALEYLGETPLAAGHYTQLRLVLAEDSNGIIANSVTPSGSTTEIALSTPSGMQSGLKLIDGFEVLAGERVDLMLDFDACKSVVTRGNGSYGLKPVMRMIPFTLNGIGGFVDSVLPGDSLAVSAQVAGTVVRATVANPLTGEFFLARLEPGNYDVVVTAPGSATTVITGVPIASATSTAMLSSAVAPLILTTSASNTISGTVTLTPASSTAVAAATAKQTVAATTTVTVQARTADLLNSTYALTLPSAPPLLGQYGTGTLPIPLTAQTAAAGQYRIEASAPGYVTQSASTTGVALESFNFALLP
jgi:hypothetical protein